MWGNYVVALSFVPSVGCSNCCTLLTLMCSIWRVWHVSMCCGHIGTDNDTKVKTCSLWAVAGPALPTTVLHPWQWPKQPWSRVQIDYAGLFPVRFLLIADSHSKRIDVHITNIFPKATSIEKLQCIFASLGLPEIIVSDNGPPFSSTEFTDFLKSNGIQHVNTIPCHPASNSLVVTVSYSSIVLLPNTTGVTPTELFMGHELHTHLDLLIQMWERQSVRDKAYRSILMIFMLRTDSFKWMIQYWQRNLALDHREDFEAVWSSNILSWIAWSPVILINWNLKCWAQKRL